jgi:hypothetical protein
MDLKESNNDLILLYKGKEIVIVLSEDEITNNTFDSLVQTGFLEERLLEAVGRIGVLEDLYRPAKRKIP